MLGYHARACGALVFHAFCSTVWNEASSRANTEGRLDPVIVKPAASPAYCDTGVGAFLGVDR